jgi:hypothetical protein
MLVANGVSRPADKKITQSLSVGLSTLILTAKGAKGDFRNVKSKAKVFHSFRHGFQDALRQATPDEELRDALAGRSSGKSVSRRYGAKAMVERWGVKALKAAIDKISYPGLDLSRVRPLANHGS